MTHRDTQRKRLYDAEDAAGINGRRSALGKRCLIDTETNASMFTLIDGARVPVPYPSVAAVQSYVDAIRTSAKFQRRWGYRGLTVDANPSGSRGGGGRLQMSADHRRDERVILHEIAHNLSSFYRYAAHGPEFAATYLELVRLFLGTEDAAALRASFTKHRVKYRNGLHAVPTPSEDRLARARRTKVRKVKPPTAKPLTVHDLAARQKARKPVAGYDASYLKGWAFHSGDMDLGQYRFSLRHPQGDSDAWLDGWLDMMAGREKFHMRECRAGRVECGEHRW